MGIGVGVLAATTVAATGAQMIGQGMAARSQAQQAKFQASQMETQALAARMEAEDREGAVRRGLADTLATQRAMFASRGIDPFSGSAVNIARADTKAMERDVRAIRISGSMAQRSLLKGARQQRAQGASAIEAGRIGMLGTAAGGVLRFKSLGGTE